MIEALYETHLYVRDLERSIAFYSKTLGLELCHREKERQAAFFWIGSEKASMLGIWEKPEAEIDIRHFAFKVSAEWIQNEALDYLAQRNIRGRNFLNDGTGQPMVFAWMPAISIYFDDPDGHILEFIGLLDGPGMPEWGILSFSDWMKKRANLQRP